MFVRMDVKSLDVYHGFQERSIFTMVYEHALYLPGTVRGWTLWGNRGAIPYSKSRGCASPPTSGLHVKGGSPVYGWLAECA